MASVSFDAGAFKESFPVSAGETKLVISQLEDIVSALQKANFSKSKKELQKTLKQVNPQQLRAILEAYSQKIGENAAHENPYAALDRVLDLLTLEQVEQVAKLKGEKFEDALTAAKEMLANAQYYLENEGHKTDQGGFVAAIKRIINTILQFIDTLITAVGLKDFTKPADNEMQASLKFQKMMMLMTLLSTITTLLVALIGGTMIGGLITGGILLLLVVLTAIYVKWIRPSPSHLPNAINFTQQYLNGEIPFVEGRKKCMDEIVKCLTKSTKPKRHPMLIGPTGVGKTEIIKGLTRAIEEGKYPELKGKKVFYLRVAGLGNSRGWSSSDDLERLSEEMGRHRENIILVLDEIHNAFPEEENATLAEKLKYYFDPGPDGFPNVIGITTEEEFYENICQRKTGGAFVRRFQPIWIENSSAFNTIRILYKYWIREAPHVLLDQNVLECLYVKSRDSFPNEPLPYSAMRLLTACLQKMGEDQKSSIAEEIDAKKEEMEFALLKEIASHNSNHMEKHDLERDIQELEEKLQHEKKKLEELVQMRQKVSESKRTLYQTIVKVAGNKNMETEAKRMLLMQTFLNPALENAVRVKGNEMKVPVAITNALVDQVVLEERELVRKSNEAKQAGKALAEKKKGKGKGKKKKIKAKNTGKLMQMDTRY